jgi:hypothetical protein
MGCRGRQEVGLVGQGVSGCRSTRARCCPSSSAPRPRRAHGQCLLLHTARSGPNRCSEGGREGAYHLSIFAGGTGKPFWSCVFTIDEHGQVVRRWRLVMGCNPSTCLGLCDKAMSRFCIDGFVGRFRRRPLRAAQRRLSAQRPHACYPALPCPTSPHPPTPLRAPDGPTRSRPVAPLRGTPSPFPPPKSHCPFVHPTGPAGPGLWPLRAAPPLQVPNSPLDAACIPRLSTASSGSTTPSSSPRPPLTHPAPGYAVAAPSAARSVLRANLNTTGTSWGLGLSDDKRQLPSQRVT